MMRLASAETTLATGNYATPSDQRLLFSSADQRLYGAFNPADRPGNKPVIVFCNSFGAGHFVTVRMEALAARMVARRGYPAFRYHPRGHGDSTGNFSDVTFEGLVEDALSAAEYARRVSGASEVVWVAVRFGTLVAAEAMRRRDYTAALALWEPVHRARDYFRSLLRRVLFHETANGRRPDVTVDDLLLRLEREESVALPGSWLHHAIYRSAIDSDLAGSLEDWSGPTLVAQIQRRSQLSPDNAALVAALERRGSKATFASVADQPEWDGIDSRWNSDALLDETAGWLDGLA
jgi:alpha/beta superfamily hydrolase